MTIDTSEIDALVANTLSDEALARLCASSLSASRYIYDAYRERWLQAVYKRWEQHAAATGAMEIERMHDDTCEYTRFSLVHAHAPTDRGVSPINIVEAATLEYANVNFEHVSFRIKIVLSTVYVPYAAAPSRQALHVYKCTWLPGAHIFLHVCAHQQDHKRKRSSIASATTDVIGANVYVGERGYARSSVFRVETICIRLPTIDYL